MAVGINSHTYVAATSQQAANEFFPAYAPMMNRIGRERGWAPLTREQFDRACGPEGHLLVGSPQQVTEKILAEHELFGHDRFLAQISVGTLPHEQVMRATELFATEVAPAVREALRRRGSGSAAESAGVAGVVGAYAATIAMRRSSTPSSSVQLPSSAAFARDSIRSVSLSSASSEISSRAWRACSTSSVACSLK